MERYPSLEQKWMIYFQLYLLLSRYLTAEQLQSPKQRSLFHKFKSAQTLEHLRAVYDETFYRLIDEIIQNVNPSKPKYMIQTKEYIDAHYNRFLLSLEEVADYLDLSPAYLSFIFKKETGINFTTYVTGKRIDVAQDLLVRSSDPIYEISEQVGYNDVKYFTKVFKKETGFTPNRYREVYN